MWVMRNESAQDMVWLQQPMFLMWLDHELLYAVGSVLYRQMGSLRRNIHVPNDVTITAMAAERYSQPHEGFMWYLQQDTGSGLLLVVGSEDGSVFMKGQTTGVHAVRVDVLPDRVRAVATRKHTIAAACTHSVTVWQCRGCPSLNLQPTKTHVWDMMAPVTSLLFGGATTLWTGAGSPGVLQLWNLDETVRATKLVGTIKGFHDGAITGLVAEADRHLMTCSLTATANVGAIWRTRAPCEVNEPPYAEPAPSAAEPVPPPLP